MKRELSTPVIVAVLVVVVILVVGAMLFHTGGPAEGKLPDASAGGIRTKGGKVIPMAAGIGAPAGRDTASGAQ